MKMSPEKLREELFKVGFFKWSENPDKAAQAILKNYKDDSMLNWTGLSNRLIGIDSKIVFKQGGMLSYFEKDLSPFFGIRGVELKLDEFIEKGNEKGFWIERKIQINGKVYDVLGECGCCWDSAFWAAIDLTNNLLVDYDVNEKIYGLTLDVLSIFIISNKKIFDFLKSIISESDIKPFDLEEYRDNEKNKSVDHRF